MIEIKNRYSGAVIFSAEAESLRLTVELAVKSGADLREADLRWANISGADLRWADLRGADLSGADLRWADLRRADLSWSNLCGADLREADLSGADLRWADLREANLDFSSGISFRCGFFDFNADIRLAAQLAYHFCRVDFGDCVEAKEAQESIKELANKFHLVEECGLIK